MRFDSSAFRSRKVPLGWLATGVESQGACKRRGSTPPPSAMSGNPHIESDREECQEIRTSGRVNRAGVPGSLGKRVGSSRGWGSCPPLSAGRLCRSSVRVRSVSLLRTGIGTIAPNTRQCPSSRRGRPAKPLWRKPHRGCESHLALHDRDVPCLWYVRRHGTCPADRSHQVRAAL